ncbi:MAG: hypothetical protein JO119_05800 [Acidobacteria bacterium]|nr:hypothetical protein [Acidobacteriota bacterium]
MSNQDPSVSSDSADKFQTRDFVDRRTFVQGVAASAIVGAAALSIPSLSRSVLGADDLDPIAKKSKSATKNPSIASRNGSASQASRPKIAA